MASPNTTHPYYPRDLQLPHYIPNDISVMVILSVFFGVTVIALGGTWWYTGTKKHLAHRNVTRMKICWFVSCALIHCILEGYFSVYHKTIAGERAFLSQLWKEYGKGDSRYMSSDTFTVCMETITGFIDGPLALAAAYAFLGNKPWRHVVQVILSMCQLYGDVLYFFTAYFEDFKHGEMYHPLHFWFYFVFLNAIWIVIPSACIAESTMAITNAQALQDRSGSKKKSK